MVCEGREPKPPQLWPDFWTTGVVAVEDPKYGGIALEYMGLPLHSWQSRMLDDGSYWMWLGWAFNRGGAPGLTGLLYFARTWQRWKALEFVSYRPDVFRAVFNGVDGNGRINGQEVGVTAAPYIPDWL